MAAPDRLKLSLLMLFGNFVVLFLIYLQFVSSRLINGLYMVTFAPASAETNVAKIARANTYPRLIYYRTARELLYYTEIKFKVLALPHTPNFIRVLTFENSYTPAGAAPLGPACGGFHPPNPLTGATAPGPWTHRYALGRRPSDVPEFSMSILGKVQVEHRVSRDLFDQSPRRSAQVTCERWNCSAQ